MSGLILGKIGEGKVPLGEGMKALGAGPSISVLLGNICSWGCWALFPNSDSDLLCDLG